MSAARSPMSWSRPATDSGRPRSSPPLRRRNAASWMGSRPHSLPDAIGRPRAAAIESVAVAFLHSYAQPAHERRVHELLRQGLPALSVSLSSEVSPEMREYERFTTTCANAYVQPLVAGYLV